MSLKQCEKPLKASFGGIWKRQKYTPNTPCNASRHWRKGFETMNWQFWRQKEELKPAIVRLPSDQMKELKESLYDHFKLALRGASDGVVRDAGFSVDAERNKAIRQIEKRETEFTEKTSGIKAEIISETTARLVTYIKENYPQGGQGGNVEQRLQVLEAAVNILLGRSKGGQSGQGGNQGQTSQPLPKH